VGLITRQRSPTECGVSECDREVSIIRRPWPSGGCWAILNTKQANKLTYSMEQSPS
jgi:hypothetical protein